MSTNKVKRGSETKKIPLELVHIEEGFNIRTDYGDLEGLMKDIVENGQKEPATVVKITEGEHKGKYKVFKGHRRTKAIKMANEQGHEIPYLIAFSVKATEEDMIIEMISSDIHKKNHTEVEVAEGMKRLLNYGYNKSEIARKTGVTHTTVGNYLLLTELTKKVKNLIQEKKLKAQDAIKMMKKFDKDPEKVQKVVFEALEAQEKKQEEVQEKKPEEEQKKGSNMLKADVLGIKPLKPLQKLNKAIDEIEERVEENKLKISDESKIEKLNELAAQLKQKDTDYETTINLLLELI